MTEFNSKNRNSFFKTIDIAGKFSIGLIISMTVTFLIAGFVVSSQQSKSFNNLLHSSNKTTQQMFEKNTKHTKKLVNTKIENLAVLLSAISPNAISASEVGTLYSYAKQVSKDNDILYVAFYDSDNKLINLSGDKNLIKKGLFISKNITRISNHGEDTASGAEKTLNSSAELFNLATELSTLMKQFKI